MAPVRRRVGSPAWVPCPLPPARLVVHLLFGLCAHVQVFVCVSHRGEINFSLVRD